MSDVPTTTIAVEDGTADGDPGARGGPGSKDRAKDSAGAPDPHPTGESSDTETDDADAADAIDATPRWVRRGRVGAAVLLVGLVMAPLLAIAVHLWTSGYHPAGDLAVIEMRVRDVGRYTPLLGPYSRYGWSHPGPLIYVLLAIPYRLAGSGSSAILSASALFNAFVVAGIGLLAWRRGRLALVAITSALLMIFVYWMTPMLLADPWNPYLTVLPVGLFVLLAWSVLERDRWCLPVLALAGSFLAQSHVGYLPLVVAVGGAVVLVALVRRWRARRASSADERPPFVPRPWRRPAGVALAIVLVAWLPVVIDQLFGTGNLRDILEYFTTSTRQPYGFGNAFELVAREWGNRAPWLGGPEPIVAAGGAVEARESGALTLPVIASLIGAGVALAGRARSALRLQALVVLTAVVTFVSVARITDVVYDYLVRWLWIVGVLIWLSALWSLWSGTAALIARAAERRRSRTSTASIAGRPRRALVGRAAVLAFVVLGGVVLADRAYAIIDLPTVLPELGSQEPLDELIPELLANVPADGTLWIRAEGGFNNADGDGLTLALERAGHRVAFDPVERYKFGPSRTTDVSDEPVGTISFVYADNVAIWEQRPGVTELARWDPLTPEERAEFITLDHALKDQFAAIGRDDLVHQIDTNDSAGLGLGMTGVDQEALKRWEQLRQRGQLIAVYLSDPPS